jgi:hypothetical protein
MVFANFFADMGERPGPAYSIDRFPDLHGDYEPGNCRWATIIEQNRNKRTNVILTLHGESHPMSEWAEITGIHVDTIRRRIVVYDWSEEEALTIPARLGQRR